MAKTLTLTAEDALFATTVEALCDKGNWQQNGDLKLGEEGKLEFAKGVLLDFMGECITGLKMKQVQSALAEQQKAYAEQIAKANLDARGAVTLAIE